MATAQQLRAAACEVPPPGSHLPSYYNPTAVNANKIMDQVCIYLFLSILQEGKAHLL